MRSPVVCGIRVIAALGDALFSIALESGRVAWRVDLEGAGRGAPPAVRRGIVVAGAHEVRAFEAASGRPIWSRNFSEGPRAIGAALGEEAVVVVGERIAVLFRLADGERIWVHAEEAVHCSCGAALPDTRPVAILSDARQVRCHDLASGRILWRAAARSEVLGGAVVHGETVLFADGPSVRGIDLDSGRDRFTLPAEARLPAPPAVAAGWLIACDEGDRVRGYRLGSV